MKNTLYDKKLVKDRPFLIPFPQMGRYSNNVKETYDMSFLKITGKTWIHLEKINTIIEKNDTLPVDGGQYLDTKLKSHAGLDTQLKSHTGKIKTNFCVNSAPLK